MTVLTCDEHWYVCLLQLTPWLTGQALTDHC